MNRTRTTRSLVTAGSALLAALALAGCGGSGGSAGTASSSADVGAGAPRVASQPAERGAPSSGKDASAGGGAAATTGQAADAATFEQRVIRTADLALVTDDVAGAVGRVRGLAAAAKGFVADEQTTTSPGEPPRPKNATTPSPAPRPWSQSVLTLRVPNASLDRVMDQVGALGSVTNRDQSSRDVTGQYVDTASRLKSQRASVDRVRTLLGKATNLGQVVQIESELSRRQADLESLEAQLAALNDQTTLATLTVNLSPLTVKPVTAPPRGAFLTGLLGGWKALVASVAVALTIIGAVLPFAVLAAVVLWPVLLVVRRRRTRPDST